jgi:outer membrane usher protein
MYLLKKTPVALFIAGLYLTAAQAEMIFPPEMLTTSGEIADLSRFRADGTQLPGDYLVDLYLNGEFVASRMLRFDTVMEALKGSVKDDTGLAPCLSREILSRAGVKVTAFPELMAQDFKTCVQPVAYVKGLTTTFNFQKMRLDISVPQIYTRTHARGYIEPELWDEGINALLMNYRFSGNNRFAGYAGSSSYFLSLDGGVNIGPWRLRDSHTWNYYHTRNGHQQQWQHIKTYAERNVTSLRSRFVAGESTTGSDVFDSVGFSGVRLFTDDNMYPDSMRGFAPVVRGVAESNAEVSIRQNGYTIYRTTVTPGSFEITDLNPMYSSGDLQVVIREASGSTRVFTIPYSSVPILQREGRVKYDLTAGHFRGAGNRYDNPVFAQGSLLWGLPHGVTVYGGMQYSRDYLGIQSGAGINMGRIGALSADITHANSALADGSKHQGQSLRVLYAHALASTGTTFRLTGYRYSTRGYHTLDETALKTMTGRYSDRTALDENGTPLKDTWSDYYNLYDNRRARFEANISQSLANYGSVWLTGVHQSYWASRGSSDSFQAGYSNALGPVSYSLNYSYTRQKTTGTPLRADRTLNLSLTVPLEKLLPDFSAARSVYATFNGSRDNRGKTSQQAGMSGTLPENNKLSWNVSQGYSSSNDSSGNAGLNYRGGYGNSNLSYSYGRGWQRIGYGIAGGALLHEDGLTLGQPLGDTSILVATPGVPHVELKNAPGVRTDWRGYAIKPWASAYHENRIAVNSTTLDDHTEVDNSITRVVPTRGAVVRTVFSARRGYRALITLHHNGVPLPFGTIVTSDGDSGIVSDDGQVYLSGLSEKGSVAARWGEGADRTCQAAYRIADDEKAQPVVRLNAECR